MFNMMSTCQDAQSLTLTVQIFRAGEAVHELQLHLEARARALHPNQLVRLDQYPVVLMSCANVQRVTVRI